MTPATATVDLGLRISGPPNTVMDLAKDGIDLLADPTSRTSVFLSLFTDAPDGGQRGWWANELLQNVGDVYGSKLWKLERSKATPDVGNEAKQYALDGLAWMVKDGVAKEVDADAQVTGKALFLTVTIYRPDGSQVSYKYQHVWDEAGWQELLTDAI